MRVLVVGPHPDDAEFGAGGWLVRLSAAGVGTFVSTFPPVDDVSGPGDPVTAKQRMDEAADAALLLGAEFRPLPPTAPEPPSAVVAAIRALLLDVAPDVVATVDSRDSHPWHRTVSLATTQAVFDAASMSASGPSQLLYMAAYTSVGFEPDLLVDVTASYGRASLALRRHATGLAVTPMLGYQMRLTHQLAGCRAAVELAEGFRLSHEFGQDWCARRAILYRLLGQ